ncbi:MAG: hypothetical protein K6U80_16115, partial [Firmicutes bacterium]|nr:hypothetical protein [Bacillota bacterium]
PTAAREGLEFCNKLFAIERELHNVTSKERYETRLTRRGNPQRSPKYPPDLGRRRVLRPVKKPYSSYYCALKKRFWKKQSKYSK